MSATCIDAFLEAVETATIETLDGVFAGDAVVDATVPNWRFSVRGDHSIRHQFAHWFANPGRFEDLRRTQLPGGELVEFVLAWEEQGVPYGCHQAHHLEVDAGRIVRDTVFCGGRWPAALLAEMEAAAAEAEAATGAAV